MTSQKTIFLIDDDADEREIFQIALEAINIPLQVHSAANGLDALHKLRASGFVLPHYIFLDLNMPLMNGLQFLEKIKEDQLLSGVPVVIYSTSSDENDIQKTRDLGALHFFIKPFNINPVKEMLLKILTDEPLPFLITS